MAKDPAFLFYPNDYIGGTMGMTFEEKGAYIELLMTQFNRGHMSEHMIGQIVGQLWDKLKDKFVKDGEGLYYNIRLHDEKIKRQEYSKSRRNNVSGINQYTKKEKKEVAHMTKHMTAHMEDVNKKVFIVKDKILKVKEEKIEVFENVFLTENQIIQAKEFFLNKYDEAISILSNYKLSSGKKYKSDYHALIGWVKEKIKKEINNGKQSTNDFLKDWASQG